jgi:hypothetical protein
MKPDETEGLAKEANRETWTLLERDDRTAEDDERMVHAAHAFAFHWQQAGGDLEAARADWPLSHVYAVLDRSGEAVRTRGAAWRRARRTASATSISPTPTRARRDVACAGDTDEAARWRTKAERAALAIADGEDRDLFLVDLAAEPWYGT